MQIIKTEQSKKFSALPFFQHVFKNQIFESAASLSYYFLFSVFPLTIFISAAFSTLHISKDNLSFLSGIIPNQILSIIKAYLSEISLGNTATLIATGIFLTIWSMGKAIQTMKCKFRLAYGINPKIHFIKEWIISLVFVFLLLVSFYASLILLVSGNQILNWLITLIPSLADDTTWINSLRLFTVSAYLAFALFGLYYILPGINQKKRYVLPGTLFSLISWVLMSWLFSNYLDKIGNLPTLYGSLGAIIALLIWLYFVNLILLIGASINSFLYLNRTGKFHEEHNALLS
jgi:membrane protein